MRCAELGRYDADGYRRRSYEPVVVYLVDPAQDLISGMRCIPTQPAL
jgi:hypothetical protein